MPIVLLFLVEKTAQLAAEYPTIPLERLRNLVLSTHEQGVDTRQWIGMSVDERRNWAAGVRRPWPSGFLKSPTRMRGRCSATTRLSRSC
jgi:hypothetical protein